MDVGAAIKKVLQGTPDDGAHFLLTLPADLFIVRRIAYGTSGGADKQPEYLGWALAGTLDAQPRWSIKKITYNSDGQITSEDFANGNNNFSNVWNDRASLSYS